MTLPIEAALPDLKRTLAAARSAVLEVPTGAGKTTMVPLALLGEPWAKGKKILMLEPRRVAARAAAARMADLLGEKVGETVGYRVRLDAKVSTKTRIEVVTEGLLTRRLQADPELKGVACVIFDEFHERSLNADLGLALTLETQAALNDDLKILVMSATLDGTRVAKLVDGPVVRSEGRLHPIETRYAPPAATARIEQSTANVILRALHETDGGLLVFLPGEGEIRTVARLLEAEDLHGATLLPLYGAMPADAQDRAIRTLPGTRKIVLATAIAETSLTIEDVRVVIDAGLQRTARYDHATGMTRLVTQRLSLASADQRRGRAGRVAPGICYRLWEEAETRALTPYTPPEILTSDLSPFALDLALWGERDASRLKLLDPPPAGTFAEAQDLLRELDAIDADNRITAHGRACATFGAHPRLAHMMLRAKELGEGATAAALAAILSERDVVRGLKDADLRTRLEAFERGSANAGLSTEALAKVDRGALARAREQARAWARSLDAKDRLNTSAAGRLTALAYPERVAKRRGPASFRMASGRGATLPETDALANQDYLAIAALDGAGANAKIHQAAPLTLADIEELFSGHIETRQVCEWSSREKAAIAREEERLFALTLAERPLKKPDAAKLAAAVLAGIRELGLKALNWTPELDAFRARVAFVRNLEPEAGWPDLSDEALTRTLETWLQPFLGGITRAADFPRIDISNALHSLFDWEQKKRLDLAAPTHVEVPSGSRIAIDYADDTPVLAVRLQEMFGLAETPTVANGRVPLTLHLLSPARRPVQVTRDLKSFWKNGYPEVKRDLKGRYPKHHWPDDPWTAIPTARAKPRGT